LCNDAYLSFYETSRDLIVPGASFEEIVRRGAERGQYVEAAGRVDAWVATRVAQHQGANGEVIEQQLGDGRWLMIVEHRTPSGYIVGNRIDITELKAATEALRQRELYLRATLDNLPFFFWLKDADCRFLAVNKVFANACGRSGPADVVGLTDHDVWPPELAQRYRTDDLEVMASRREKIRRGAGGRRLGSRLDRNLQEAGDRPGRHHPRHGGLRRDISDRRRAEARAHEHAEQLNAIFDLSPDGFVSFDGARCVKYVSPAFSRLTGLEAEACIGLDEAVFAPAAGRALHSPKRALPALRRCASRARPSATAPGAAHERRQTIEIAGPGRRVLEVGLRESRAETVSQILYLRDITHEIRGRPAEERVPVHRRARTAHADGQHLRLCRIDAGAGVRARGAARIPRHHLPPVRADGLDHQRAARPGPHRGPARQGFQHPAHRPAGTAARSRRRFQVARRAAVAAGPPAANGPRWVRGDRKKLTQAIGNVLSNAYKYSPGGGTVGIELPRRAGDQLGIRVTRPGHRHDAGAAGPRVRALLPRRQPRARFPAPAWA
jgi:PAS domain-containing protein